MPKSGKHRVNTIDSFFRVRPSSQNIREGENISFLEDGKLIKQEKRNGVVYEQIYVEQNTSEKQRSAAATGDVTNLIVQGSSTSGADITGITAGTGLTGGGASGNITLNVVGGTGITANANDIAIDSTVATLTGTQTLTNKSIDLDSNTLTGTLTEFNTALQGDSFVSLTGTETLTNKTLAAPTFTGTAQGASLTLTGDLTVQGDTTTLNTATLQVEDNNIVLNYHASNDTSSTANGSGITIQDAVNSTTDATMLWNATNDDFDFSHTVTAPSFTGDLTGNADTATRWASGVDINLSGDVSGSTGIALDGSGDVTIGATIQTDAVEAGMLNDNIISGQTAITTGLADTDELLLSDAGVLKKVDISVLESKFISGIDALTLANFNSDVVIVDSEVGSVIRNDSRFLTASATESVIESYGYTTNTGTVTSVAVSGGNGLTSSGGPITDSGTITLAVGAGTGIATNANDIELDINSLGSSPQVVRNGSEEIAVWDPDYNTSSGQTAKITLDDVSDYVQAINFTGTTDGVMTRNANGTLTAESGLTYNGTLLHISKDVETTGTTGTTLLKLTNDVGTDLSQQKTFVDFTFLDDNSNETPQVRIGAEVGQNGDANSQLKEGSGAFIVYTNNADTTSGDAGASLAERMRVDYQGRVGIGTSTPSYKLDVAGIIRTTGEIYLDAGGDSIAFMGVSDANYRKALYSTNDDHYLTNRHTGGDLILMSNNGSGGGETERLRFVAGSGTQNAYFSNVNVGIGNSSPSRPLQIGTTTTNGEAIKLDGNASYGASIYYSRGGGYNWNAGVGGASSSSSNIPASYWGIEDVSQGNAVRLAIAHTTGRIGINTNPGAFLDITKDNNNSGNQFRVADTEGGTAAVRTYSTSDGTGLILNHYYAVGGSPYMRYSDFVSSMGDGAATTMRFLTKPASANPAVAMVIDNSQNVGIGTSSPGALLDVNGTGYIRTAVFSDAFKPYSGTLATYGSNSSTDHYFVGDVGIGVTPSYKLDVAGDINLSQSQGIRINGNYRLYGDGNYTTLRKPDGSIALYIGGSDAANYYDHTRHRFRPSGGGSNYYMTVSTGGLGISRGSDDAEAKLHIGDADNSNNALASNVLGTTSGDSIDYIKLECDSTNANQLIFSSERIANGSDWTTTRERIYRKVDASNMGYIQFGSSFAASTADMISFGEVGVGDYMGITGDGKVGIGTNSPTGKLDVVPDTDGYSRIGRARVGYVGFADYAGFSHIDRANVSQYAMIQQSDGATFINSASGTPIYFRESNATKMILTGGRLLIGDTSVHYSGTDLQVGNTSDSANGIQIQTSTTGNGYVLFGDGTGASAYRGQVRYDHTNDSLNLTAGGTETVYVKGGRVGIGVSSPWTSTKLDLGADSNAHMRTGGRLYFYDSNRYIGRNGSDIEMYANTGTVKMLDAVSVFNKYASASGDQRNTYNHFAHKIAANQAGAFICNTDIPRASNRMTILHFEGYAYGDQAVIDFKICFYPYSGSNGQDGVAGRPLNYSIVDNGNDGRQKFIGVNSSGNIAVAIGDYNDPNKYYWHYHVNILQGHNDADLGSWTGTTSTTNGFGWLDKREMRAPIESDRTGTSTANVRINSSLGVNVNASGTAGRADFANDVVAFATSDERLKENVKPLDNALDKILQISGVSFDWKELTEEEKRTIHGNEGHDVGVIAQEIEEVLPEVVTTRDSGYKAVKYEKIVPLLIEAIKEQQKQIEELKNG